MVNSCNVHHLPSPTRPIQTTSLTLRKLCELKDFTRITQQRSLAEDFCPSGRHTRVDSTPRIFFEAPTTKAVYSGAVPNFWIEKVTAFGPTKFQLGDDERVGEAQIAWFYQTYTRPLAYSCSWKNCVRPLLASSVRWCLLLSPP